MEKLAKTASHQDLDDVPLFCLVSAEHVLAFTMAQGASLKRQSPYWDTSRTRGVKSTGKGER